LHGCCARYLVEKSPEKAKEFFGCKREFCVDNNCYINKVQAIVASKRKNLESVQIVLQGKVQQGYGGLSYRHVKYQRCTAGFVWTLLSIASVADHFAAKQ